ncbi:uncharacterized protein LOC116798029 isoform X2 [Chiroxiphia lanceolata]|uniref:uncharacterized protein LOC116798029 isoform X2 n=1 Tax=Chiroxiphia lanceolata TaxID=296741 RepID=UPI0013CF2A5C|nr:uncharacterized protein LOC116798029 isoform X2 [Chiroxiphia lanceolata]
MECDAAAGRGGTWGKRHSGKGSPYGTTRKRRRDRDQIGIGIRTGIGIKGGPDPSRLGGDVPRDRGPGRDGRPREQPELYEEVKLYKNGPREGRSTTTWPSCLRW